VAVQRSTITRLRQEVDSLRLQLEAAGQARANIAEPPAATLPEEQLRELLRLRGKAGLFRSQVDELAQLQQENRRLRGELASAQPTAAGTTNAFAARSPVSLADLAFAGYATPEAALESLLWSERETNLTAYMTGLLPAQQSEEQARLQRQFRAGRWGTLFSGTRWRDRFSISGQQAHFRRRSRFDLLCKRTGTSHENGGQENWS